MAFFSLHGYDMQTYKQRNAQIYETNSYVRLHLLINATTLHVKYKYTHVNIQSSIHKEIEIIITMMQYNNICLLVFIQLFPYNPYKLVY